MEIEAKRSAESAPSSNQSKKQRLDRTELTRIFQQYQQSYERLEIHNVEELQIAIDRNEEEMRIRMGEHTSSDFSYLSVFPLLKKLTLWAYGEEEGNYDSEDFPEDDEEEEERFKQRLLEGMDRLGPGLEKTNITTLIVDGGMHYVTLDMAMAPTTGKLTHLELRCCVRLRADEFTPNVVFDFRSLETLIVGDKPEKYYDFLESEIAWPRWCYSVPSLKDLRVINVEDGPLHPELYFPNVERIRIEYCSSFRGFNEPIVNPPCPHLKKLTFFHCDFHFLDSDDLSRYPTLEFFELNEDKGIRDDEDSGWEHEHFIELSTYETAFCPLLKHLRVRWMPNMDDFKLYEGSTEPALLESINLNYSTSNLILGPDAGRRFPHLKEVIVASGENYDFPLDILQLPSLEKYRGSYVLNVEDGKVIDLDKIGNIADTTFIRGLFDALMEVNADVVLISSVHGVIGASNEMQTLYERYAPQYQAMGYASLLELYRWQPVPAHPHMLVWSASPLLLEDFTCLSFFQSIIDISEVRIQSHEDMDDPGLLAAANQRQSFVQCKLGPHLLKALPNLSRFTFHSYEHELVDVDDRCFASEVALVDFLTVNLQLKIALRRNQVLLPNISHLTLGTEISSFFISNGVHAIRCLDVQQTTWENVDARSLRHVSFAEQYPVLHTLRVRSCNLSTIPSRWTSPSLQQLNFNNVAFASLPSTDFATVFPALKTLNVENEYDRPWKPYTSSFTEERINDRYRMVENISINNIRLHKLTVESTQPMALEQLKYEVNMFPPWMRDVSTILSTLDLRTPTMLPHIQWVKWKPLSGVFPLDILSLPVIAQDGFFSYNGTYMLHPSFEANPWLDMDAYTTNANFGYHIDQIQQMNPTIQIHSTAMEQWRIAQAERARREQEEEDRQLALRMERENQRLARQREWDAQEFAEDQRRQVEEEVRHPHRIDPFFIKYDPSLICGRTETLAAMDENNILWRAIVNAILLIERAANATQKTAYENALFQRAMAIKRGETPPAIDTENKADEMEPGKMALMLAIRSFNEAFAIHRISAEYANDFFHLRIADTNQPSMSLEKDKEEAVKVFNATHGDVQAWFEADGSVSVGRHLSFQLISPFYDTTCNVCQQPFHRMVHDADVFPATNAELLGNPAALQEAAANDQTGEGLGGVSVCNYTLRDYMKQHRLHTYPLSLKETRDSTSTRCNHMKHFFHRICYADLLLNQERHHRFCILTRDEFAS